MIFGLIGKKLGHSFSKAFFESKFSELRLPHQYLLFEIASVNEIEQLRKQHPDLVGLNVTIPYKETIIPLLDELDETASAVGAVNTVLFENGKRKGFNTDVVGFEQSLQKFYAEELPKQAIVFGSGGSSKAVQYVLRKNGFDFVVISRSKSQNSIPYEELNQSMINNASLLVNTTPVGMLPDESILPISDFSFSDKHFFFDLIYNPEKTATAKLLESKGVHIKNGLEMLQIQAEASWQLWASAMTRMS